MRVKWLRRALADLDDIAEFIALENPAKAFEVVNEIVRQLGALSDQPAIGRPGRVAGTRELEGLST